MPKKPLDVKGFYRIIRVDPEASPDEIRLAYAMAKQNAAGAYLKRIDEAYGALKDPGRRAEYDHQGHARANPLKSPYTLAGSIAALVLVLAVVFVPAMSRRLRSFSAGKALVDARSGRAFGVVVRHEEAHAFPQGGSSPAYLVRLAANGEERWYPARDIQETCEAR